MFIENYKGKKTYMVLSIYFLSLFASKENGQKEDDFIPQLQIGYI